MAAGPARSWWVAALAALTLAGLVGGVLGAAVHGWLGRPPPATGPPPADGSFRLEPVGSFASLPTDRRAAAMVHRSTWEPRLENRPYNRVVPERLVLVPKNDAERAYDPRWNRYVQGRISGNFTGTTDEILQWAAAKWGVPDNVLRAVALRESDWRQANSGDDVTDPAQCAEVDRAPPCPVTYGIVGTRSTSWPGLFPWNRDSTAAAVDVLGGWLRGCYEGWVWWLRDHGDRERGVYRAGDLWGCVGAWFSGDWHDGQVGTLSGQDYIHRAREAYQRRPWLMQHF